MLSALYAIARHTGVSYKTVDFPILGGNNG